MNEGLSILKPKEHLDFKIKGAKPIIACAGSFNDYVYHDIDPEQVPIEENFNERLNNVYNVNYSSFPDDLKKRDFLNAGWNTYVLSVVDNNNKFSEGFFDCTGLIVAGIDKETGKNISFLSHQDPKEFLLEKKKDFIKHLEQRLADIKNRCVLGTIDAVIVGGKYLAGNNSKGVSNKKIYLDSIELLSLEIKKTLGFEPVVINGPKKISGKDDIYYDNENRRLYFLRQKVNEDTGSFTQSSIEEEKKKWG